MPSLRLLLHLASCGNSALTLALETDGGGGGGGGCKVVVVQFCWKAPRSGAWAPGYVELTQVAKRPPGVVCTSPFSEEVMLSK